MTLFRYEAVDAAGRTRTGEIEATSLPAALSQLAAQGLNPFRAEAAGYRQTFSQPLSFGALGLAWRSRFVRQLAALLGAGVALDRALALLVAQAVKAREKTAIQSILDGISRGTSLAQALKDGVCQFRSDEVGLVQAGEHAGSLQTVLEELASLLERRLALQAKLTSAFVYPAFLMALAPASLIIIATVLVPNIAPLFENTSAEPPIVLRLLIGLSHSLRDAWPIWIGGTALFLLAGLALHRTGRLGQMIAASSLSLPVLRTIRRRAEAGRICRTLGSLLHGGSPLQAALSAVAAVATLPASKRQLEDIRDRVTGGEKLGAAMTNLSVLSPSAIQMIAIGEETARLDTMLTFVAESEEKDLAAYLDRLMSLLTPLLTVVIGILIGGIVMSIMQAILSVNELAVR